MFMHLYLPFNDSMHSKTILPIATRDTGVSYSTHVADTGRKRSVGGLIGLVSL